MGGQPYDDDNAEQTTDAIVESVWEKGHGECGSEAEGTKAEERVCDPTWAMAEKKGYHFVEAETLNFSVLPRWIIS